MIHPESGLLVNVRVACLGLEAGDPEEALRVEEYHDSLTSVWTAPAIADRADEVHGQCALDFGLGQKDATTSVEGGGTKALKILVRRDILRPLQVILDVLAMLRENSCCRSIWEHVRGEIRSELGYLRWCRTPSRASKAIQEVANGGTLVIGQLRDHASVFPSYRDSVTQDR
jgi:hypothetical protein